MEMNLKIQHTLLMPNFAQWPVSDVHRQPVLTLIEGTVKILESLGLEGSPSEVEHFLSLLPETPRSEQLIADAKNYLVARKAHIESLNPKEIEQVKCSLSQP
jgi:hypothetical protein